MQALFSSYWRFLIFTLLVTVHLSCKKEKEVTPEPPSVSISISVDQLKGYEIGILTVSNFTLNKTNYELDFGGKKIAAIKNADNSLSFLTPEDLASGSYVIKAGFATNSISVAVTAPETISDPGTYVTGLIGNTSQTVQDYLDISGESSVPALLSTAKTNLDQALLDFNAIPLADQQILAQILKANEAFFTEAEQLIADFKGVQSELPNARTTGDNWAFSDCSNIKCKIAFSIGKVGAVLLLAKAGAILGTAAALVVGIDIALSIMTNKRSLMLGVVLAIAETAFKFAYFAPNYTTEVWLDIFDNTIKSGMRVGASSTMNILKGEPFTFKPNVEFSSLKPSLNTQNELVLKAIASIAKGKAFYTNTLGSPSGPFPAYKNITETKKINTISELEITILNNPSVTVTAPVGTAEEFSVIFNTNLSPDQTFTLSVKYIGDFETTTRTFPIKLVSNRQPQLVTTVSGDNQMANLGITLPMPLTVSVTDGNAPLEGILVEWNVTLGGGSLSAATSLTNNAGVAQITWTLGNSSIEQQISATVKRADGSQVSGSPLYFNAYPPCDASTIVTDIDGNSYNAVAIGYQCWMKENLTTTKFNNGDPIVNIPNAQFTNLSTPAWCNYEDNTTYGTIYGKLYSAYTIEESRNVCPVGWHVPTVAEIEELYAALGGQNVAAYKLKEAGNTHWITCDPNNTTCQTPATNSSGFTALPGGASYQNQGQVGYRAVWWARGYWNFAVNSAYDRAELNTFYDWAINYQGLSVRCLRDTR